MIIRCRIGKKSSHVALVLKPHTTILLVNVKRQKKHANKLMTLPVTVYVRGPDAFLFMDCANLK